MGKETRYPPVGPRIIGYPQHAPVKYWQTDSTEHQVDEARQRFIIRAGSCYQENSQDLKRYRDKMEGYRNTDRKKDTNTANEADNARPLVFGYIASRLKGAMKCTVLLRLLFAQSRLRLFTQFV